MLYNSLCIFTPLSLCWNSIIKICINVYNCCIFCISPFSTFRRHFWTHWFYRNFIEICCAKLPMWECENLCEVLTRYTDLWVIKICSIFEFCSYGKNDETFSLNQNFNQNGRYLNCRMRQWTIPNKWSIIRIQRCKRYISLGSEPLRTVALLSRKCRYEGAETRFKKLFQKIHNKFLQKCERSGLHKFQGVLHISREVVGNAGHSVLSVKNYKHC